VKNNGVLLSVIKFHIFSKIHNSDVEEQRWLLPFDVGEAV
jgi:hypothetical protein